MLTKTNADTVVANTAAPVLHHRERRPHPARYVAQAILMVAVLAVGLAGMAALIRTKPELPKRPPFPTVYTVETAVARSGDFQPVITVYGEIAAARSVDLRALVAGEIVSVSPRLKAGAGVTKGEALVEIDRFAYEGALREARANLAETEARIVESRAAIRIEENKLERAREQLDLARRDLERIRALKTSGNATDKQVEERELIESQRAATAEQTEISITAQKAKLAQQEAVVERLRWKVDEAGRNLANTVLTAPFTGIVRSAAAEIGKMVGVNDVAVSLYEKGNLEVRFTLSDDRYARIQSDETGAIGRSVEVVTGNGGVALTAVIDRLGADIENTRGGVQVYARLQSQDIPVALRPGAFVEVRVPDKTFADHYRLPESAVYDASTVYAVVDGRLRARPVSISAYDGNMALVSGGLSDGDEILVTRISEIGEGLRVARPGQQPADQGAAGKQAGE